MLTTLEEYIIGRKSYIRNNKDNKWDKNTKKYILDFFF